MGISIRRLSALLSISLGILLGIILSNSPQHMASAGLTCSDLTGCLGGNGCGSSGLPSSNCVLQCSGGGTVHCAVPN